MGFQAQPFGVLEPRMRDRIDVTDRSGRLVSSFYAMDLNSVLTLVRNHCRTSSVKRVIRSCCGYVEHIN